MQPIRSGCTLLATGLALVLAFLPGRLAAAAPDAKEPTSSPAEKIKKQLDQTTTLEIADQPLSLALNQIREQTKINFVIDRFTIQQMGMDPEQMPVSAKLKDVKVRSALRRRRVATRMRCTASSCAARTSRSAAASSRA